MKIYTRTGDDGTTGLIGGQRVAKSDPRLECIGTVDELNAALGLAAVAAGPGIRDALRAAQNDLLNLGSHLAMPDIESASVILPAFDETIVARLEAQIDQAEQELPPLCNFILPGGGESAARLHIARTVCRRAERLLVAYAEHCPVPAIIVIYLNRLSDWLFVQARLANHRDGIEDVPWRKQP